MTKIEYIVIPDIPIIKVGDDISSIILDASKKSNISICNNDIIIIAQKIVSIAENAIVNLNDVKPSDKAMQIAKVTGRSPEECQIYLN